ncbi:predicted protein [Sclerotinia sclerotiorum 1980 UF-70]|uniref:Uncharacterized protein n=1 Tax=Sclerotinia sclerotiorum (strain ATCC 18683 / 1980 / Ss-1) TaxID=665079 RepID=A7F8N2_SCLS1|nr:predicted protein [Sclerotinia sclerotiorum 1980 UF-70]EDN99103.1 predicted protein [Sclerotinia sclerotiorum 1980 UF-70]
MLSLTPRVKSTAGWLENSDRKAFALLHYKELLEVPVPHSKNALLPSDTTADDSSVGFSEVVL